MKKQTKSYNVQPLKTEKEISEIEWYLEKKTNQPERNMLIWLIGLNTMLRMSDIVNLKVGDVRQNNPTIIEKKTGKPRKLWLGGLRTEIDEFLKSEKLSDDRAYLFQSRQGNGKPIQVQTFYRLLTKAGELLGRDDLGTHTMRKTGARAFYQQTGDIATLQKILNHSTPAITLKYIGITQDDIDNRMKEFRIG